MKTGKLNHLDLPPTSSRVFAKDLYCWWCILYQPSSFLIIFNSAFFEAKKYIQIPFNKAIVTQKMGKGEDQQKANSAPSSSANQFLSSNTDLCIFRPNDIEALENKLTGILSSPSCSPSSCPSTPTTAMSRATSTDLSSTRHGTTTSTESGSSFSGDEFSTVVVGLLNSTARTPTPLLVQEEKTRRFQEYRTFDLELGHRSMPGLKDPGAHQVRNPMIDISEKEAALAELKGCPPALAGFGDQHVLGVMSLNEGSAEEAFPVARVVGDGEGNGDNGKQVQEAEEIDPRKKFEKTRRAICISVLILFVLVGVLACVVALVVLPSTEDDKSRFGAAGSSTLHPEQAVSMAPTTYRESLGIQEQVEKVMGSSRIRNPTTPHHKALQWILHEDPMELLADAPNLIQRYILTLFYFQTSAERPWRSCNPPNETLLLEKGSHRCELEEIIWVHPELVFKSVPNQTRWLSYEHECEWVGVLCDEYDDVFDLFLGKICNRCIG